MIGARDRLWIAAKKLSLRKRWMGFTLFSLSLGLTVFTSTTSLAEGIRAAFVNTLELMWRKVPADNVRIEPSDHRKLRTPNAISHPITSEQASRIATLPGVEAVTPVVIVKQIKLSLELETVEPVSTLSGMEEAFLARFVPPGRKLWERPDRVPIIVGRYLLQSRYDERSARFRVRREPDAVHVGRELELIIGANANITTGFREEYRKGKKRIVRTTPEERMSRSSEQYRYLRNRYDMNIFQRALRLKAVIAGVGDFDHCLIPLSVARDTEAWLKDRELLADRTASASSAPESAVEDDPGHPFLWALARTPADVPRVAAAVEAMGLHPTHRGTMVGDAMAEFSSAMRIVQYIFYGIGLVIFLVSCLFVWSTMSKVIADSRREIGVFRAVGATRRDVLSIFLLQATLLGLGGALIGVMCGFGVAAGISKLVIAHARQQDLAWDIEQYGFEVDDVLPAALYSVDPLACGAMIVGAVLASLIAGLVPAWRAANMDPVAALNRRE